MKTGENEGEKEEEEEDYGEIILYSDKREEGK